MLAAALPVRAEPLVLGRFSAGDLDGWELRHFEGETRYRIVEAGGSRVLEAESEAAASSLYLERGIDLAARPVLEWRWRVEAPLSRVGRARQGRRRLRGARLCRWRRVRGCLRCRSRFPMSGPAARRSARTGRIPSPPGCAWSRSSPARSACRPRGSSYRRNLREDFRRLFGREVDELEGVAVMTDADNSRQRARAWYGDILLRAEGG